MADQYNREDRPGTGKLFAGKSTHPDAAHWRGFVVAHRDIRAGERVQLSVWDKGVAPSGVAHMDVKMDDGATGLTQAVYGGPRDDGGRGLPGRYQPRRDPRPDQGAGPAPARRPAPPPRPAPQQERPAPKPPADDDIPW